MAALAVTEICRNNFANQTATAELGAISSLVQQLRGGAVASAGAEEVKAEAAGAIWVLSEGHVENKVAISCARGRPLEPPRRPRRRPTLSG